MPTSGIGEVIQEYDIGILLILLILLNCKDNRFATMLSH